MSNQSEYDTTFRDTVACSLVARSASGSIQVPALLSSKSNTSNQPEPSKETKFIDVSGKWTV
jgi:hypothetical protein